MEEGLDQIASLPNEAGSAEERTCSGEFIDVVTRKVILRGHLCCSRCGRTFREHALRALRSAPEPMDHDFVGRE